MAKPLAAQKSVYPVNKIKDDFIITGTGSSPLWKEATVLSDFTYPWEKGDPSPTSFRALHSDAWIYFLFNVVDSDVKIYVDSNEKSEAVRSDRAEIFLRKDAAMSPYYCLEIDAAGRVFDCKGEFYRKLDTSWAWPDGHLKAKSTATTDGYVVEIAISKTSLNELSLLNDGRLEAGLFRADCIELKGKQAKFKWISWLKPETSAPDFHTPSAFGVLQLR
jgi:hypothetical protein